MLYVFDISMLLLFSGERSAGVFLLQKWGIFNFSCGDVWSFIDRHGTDSIRLIYSLF